MQTCRRCGSKSVCRKLHKQWNTNFDLKLIRVCSGRRRILHSNQAFSDRISFNSIIYKCTGRFICYFMSQTDYFLFHVRWFLNLPSLTLNDCAIVGEYRLSHLKVLKYLLGHGRDVSFSADLQKGGVLNLSVFFNVTIFVYVDKSDILLRDFDYSVFLRKAMP